NPAAINRASRIPTTNEITGCRLGLTSFDPEPFCAAPMPNQKRSLSIAKTLAATIGFYLSGVIAIGIIFICCRFLLAPSTAAAAFGGPAGGVPAYRGDF